jgi:hypothetical protein
LQYGLDASYYGRQTSLFTKSLNYKYNPFDIKTQYTSAEYSYSLSFSATKTFPKLNKAQALKLEKLVHPYVS